MTSLAERVAAVKHPAPSRSTIVSWATLIGILAVGVWSIWQLAPNAKDLADAGANIQRYLSQATPMVWPGFQGRKDVDTGVVTITFEGWEAVWTFVGHVVITLAITFAATALAAVLSVPVAYGAARNTTPHPIVMAICRGIGVVTRAVPDVVLIGFLAYLWLSGGTIVAIIGVGVHSVGMISKMMADAIETVDPGPVSALKATGGTKGQQFWSAVVPQALPAWIAVTLHRADINLRASVILGVVGVVGIGYDLWEALHTNAGMRESIPLVIIFILLCIVFEIISSTLRAKLLNVRPTGKGLGDTLVRAVTTRSAVAAKAIIGEATGPVVDRNARIEAALHRPWDRGRISTAAWIWSGVVVIVLSFVYSAWITYEDGRDWCRVIGFSCMSLDPENGTATPGFEWLGWRIVAEGAVWPLVVGAMAIIATVAAVVLALVDRFVKGAPSVVRPVMWTTAVIAVVSLIALAVPGWRFDMVHNPESAAKQPALVFPLSFGSAGWDGTMSAVLVTLQVAFAALLLTAIFSVFVGPLSARNVAPNGWVRNTMRVIALILRATPDLVIAIILLIAIGLGPRPAMIAMAIGGIGLLAKLIGDSMEEVPNGPERAIQTVGGTRTQVFFASTLPMSVPTLVSHLMYMLEQNVRNATLLGIVGGGGIGYLMINQLDARQYNQVAAFLLVIIVMVLVVETVSNLVRQALK